jgi:hypothetical protein
LLNLLIRKDLKFEPGYVPQYVVPQEFVLHCFRQIGELLIRLATASLHPECSLFHTFDGEGRSKGTNLRLLDLNGLVQGFKPYISLPYQPNGLEVGLFDDYEI